MKKLVYKFLNPIRNEEGQGMVEYGLIIALIAVIVIAALLVLGPKVAGIFTDVASKL
jgi:pilus assembly protein Flp/PilA